MSIDSQQPHNSAFDLRTQIHSIIGFAELAMDEKDLQQQSLCLTSIIETAMSLLVILGEVPEHETMTERLAKPRFKIKTLDKDPLSQQSNSRAPGRILLAEDNHTNQMLALRLLLKHGYQVTVVTHGREALERLQEEEFDLVLMDLHMPVMDGITALQHIRLFKDAKTSHDVPVVVLSADSSLEEEGADFGTLGFDAWFVKPFESNRLFPLIDKLLLKRMQAQTVSM